MAGSNSGAALLLSRTGAAPTDPKTTLPSGTLQTSGGFWREYFRVQSDKLLMFALILVLHWIHADEKLQAAAIGGLIILIQGQRFKLG